MLRLTAERRALARDTGAPTGHPSTCEEDIGVCDSSITSAPRPVSASRIRAKPVRTTLVCALGIAVLAGLVVAVPWLADRIPNMVAGLCLIVLGFLFGVMLAVRA